MIYLMVISAGDTLSVIRSTIEVKMPRLAILVVLVAPLMDAGDCSAQNTATHPPADVWQLAVRNGTYGGITLRDGEHKEAGSMLYVDRLAVGDLDADGVEDAAVILVSWGGGTGFFYSLTAVRNDHGRPVVSADVQLGDRIKVQSLTVHSGQIDVTYLTQGPNDGMCCATLRTEARFVLRGGRLERNDPGPRNIGPVAESQTATTQSSQFVLRFGQTQPAHAAWRTWAEGTPLLRQHLAWLSSQLALPQDIPVNFASCGEANAYYDPRARSITMCYEWIVKRENLARASFTNPTPVAITDAVTRSTLYVVDHEIGHALIDLLGIPVLGREEDAADGFSAFIMLERGSPTDAYSVLQGALSNGQHYIFDGGNKADVHSLNDQRFYNMLCWLLGSDSARFTGTALQAGLPLFRERTCPHEWAQLRSSWISVLGPKLRGAADLTTTSVNGNGVPTILVNNQTVSIAQGRTWASGFRTRAGQCRVRLDVAGVQGGNLDFVAYVFDTYNYNNWVGGARMGAANLARPLFQSAQVAQLGTEIPIRGPGEFVVVVSNQFSLLTPKLARVSVAVTCP